MATSFDLSLRMTPGVPPRRNIAGALALLADHKGLVGQGRSLMAESGDSPQDLAAALYSKFSTGQIGASLTLPDLGGDHWIRILLQRSAVPGPNRFGIITGRCRGEGAEVLATFAQVQELLGAPILTLAANPGDANGWTNRNRAAKDLVFAGGGAGLDHVHFLQGIATFTVISGRLAQWLGTDRFESLGSGYAQPYGTSGAWLAIGDAEMSGDTWGERERVIIEALGPERFFDPSEPRLPEQVPPNDWFQPAPFPLIFDDGAGGNARLHPDGRSESYVFAAEPAPELPARFVADAAEATREFFELGAGELGFDGLDGDGAPLYWVEHALFGTGPNPLRVAIWGAWLGEYVCSVVPDGAWASTADQQWVVATPAGSLDPFGLVAQLLAGDGDQWEILEPAIAELAAKG